MSRLILVVLAMIFLVSFVQGKRFVAYNNFTLIPAPFTGELYVSRRMYQVKLYQNGPDPLCNITGRSKGFGYSLPRLIYFLAIKEKAVK